ncbi:MAG: DUF169 domain-containing protein [Deltaproteobacteria bacterium]|nr:DUF169 domain-containing protein [Deltaproteobacteria bacterium]
MGTEKYNDINSFLEALGQTEEPMGVYYTDDRPETGFNPIPGTLPTRDQEARGEIDWTIVWKDFSCVLGHVWRARKKQTTAFFSVDQFGCLGGAFYLGYLGQQLDMIADYVSTGIPNVMEGERYLSSPQVCHKFFEHVNPRPAPKKFCVFKPISQFSNGHQPEIVVFFARPEVLCGLCNLAVFVTEDFEVVVTPFGAGCTAAVAWPAKFIAEGKLKAVLGGWDPSARPYLKTDELIFSVPYELYTAMLTRWPESFLTAGAWRVVKKKVARSRKTWGEE